MSRLSKYLLSACTVVRSPGLAREVFFTTTSESQVYMKDPEEGDDDEDGASDFACLQGLRVVETVLQWARSAEAAVSGKPRKSDVFCEPGILLQIYSVIPGYQKVVEPQLRWGHLQYPPYPPSWTTFTGLYEQRPISMSDVPAVLDALRFMEVRICTEGLSALALLMPVLAIRANHTLTPDAHCLSDGC